MPSHYDQKRPHQHFSPDELLRLYPGIAAALQWTESDLGWLLLKDLLSGYFDRTSRKPMIRLSSIDAILEFWNKLIGYRQELITGPPSLSKGNPCILTSELIQQPAFDSLPQQIGWSEKDLNRLVRMELLVGHQTKDNLYLVDEWSLIAILQHRNGLLDEQKFQFDDKRA